MDQALQREAAAAWEGALNPLSFRIAMGGSSYATAPRVLLYGEILKDGIVPHQSFLGELILIRPSVVLFVHFQRQESPGILTGLVHPREPGHIHPQKTYHIEPFRNPGGMYDVSIQPEKAYINLGYEMAVHENWGRDAGGWNAIPNHHWNERLKPFLETYLPINP